MNTAASTDKLQSLVAEAWKAPRRKLDTATVLEVFATQFTIAVFAGMLGLLSTIIGVVAMVAGQKTHAQGIGPGAVGFGVCGVIVGVVMLVRIASGRKQYAGRDEFAAEVLEHIVSKPSAPNMHLYERLAVPGTLGERDADESDSLRAWMEETQQKVTAALLAAAGVQPDEKLYQGAPATAVDGVRPQLMSDLGDLQVDPLETCEVGGQQVPVWIARQHANFRFKPEHTLGPLTTSGEKVAEAAIRAQLTAVVMLNAVGDWYVLQLGVTDLDVAAAPLPGAAEEVTKDPD